MIDFRSWINSRSTNNIDSFSIEENRMVEKDPEEYEKEIEDWKAGGKQGKRPSAYKPITMAELEKERQLDLEKFQNRYRPDLAEKYKDIIKSIKNPEEREEARKSFLSTLKKAERDALIHTRKVLRDKRKARKQRGIEAGVKEKTANKAFKKFDNPLKRELNDQIKQKFGFPTISQQNAAGYSALIDPSKTIMDGILTSTKFKLAKRAGRYIPYEDIFTTVVSKMCLPSDKETGENGILHGLGNSEIPLDSRIASLNRDNGILSMEKESDGKTAVEKALLKIRDNATAMTDQYFSDEEKRFKQYGKDSEGQDVEYGQSAAVSARRFEKSQRVGKADVPKKVHGDIASYFLKSLDFFDKKNELMSLANFLKAKEILRVEKERAEKEGGELINAYEWKTILDDLEKYINPKEGDTEESRQLFKKEISEKLKKITGRVERTLDPQTKKIYDRLTGLTSRAATEPVWGGYATIEDITFEKLTPSNIEDVLSTIERRSKEDTSKGQMYKKLLSYAPILLQNIKISADKRSFVIYDDETKKELEDFKKTPQFDSLNNATKNVLRSSQGETYFYLMKKTGLRDSGNLMRTYIAPLNKLFIELGERMGQATKIIKKNNQEIIVPDYGTKTYKQRQAKKSREKQAYNKETKEIIDKIKEMQKEDDDREAKGQTRLHVVANTKGEGDNLLMGFKSGIPESGYHDDISSYGKPKGELAELRKELKSRMGKLFYFTSPTEKQYDFAEPNPSLVGPQKPILTRIEPKQFASGTVKTYRTRKEMLDDLPKSEREKYKALAKQGLINRKKLHSPYDIVRVDEPLGDEEALRKFHAELKDKPDYLQQIKREHRLLFKSGWKSLFEHFCHKVIID